MLSSGNPDFFEETLLGAKHLMVQVILSKLKTLPQVIVLRFLRSTPTRNAAELNFRGHRKKHNYSGHEIAINIFKPSTTTTLSV
jgi:hypothetical protein